MRNRYTLLELLALTVTFAGLVVVFVRQRSGGDGGCVRITEHYFQVPPERQDLRLPLDSAAIDSLLRAPSRPGLEPDSVIYLPCVP